MQDRNQVETRRAFRADQGALGAMVEQGTREAMADQ